MHVALRRPSGWSVSCSWRAPGHRGPAERATRRRRRALASDLERIPFGDFIERCDAAAVRRRPPDVGGWHAPTSDATARMPGGVLRGRARGNAAPMDRLGELRMPVTVLVGDRDTVPGDRTADGRLLADGELIVAAGGHGLPLENPRPWRARSTPAALSRAAASFPAPARAPPRAGRRGSRCSSRAGSRAGAATAHRCSSRPTRRRAAQAVEVIRGRRSRRSPRLASRPGARSRASRGDVGSSNAHSAASASKRSSHEDHSAVRAAERCAWPEKRRT